MSVDSKKVRDAGFVSIIVAALLMVVLSLITIGFTRLMQREQRQALDRQLSRTALYAAESGINDVLAAIDGGAYAGVTSKTDCDPSALPSQDLSGDGSVGVTCALFDQTPGELTYDLEASDSKVIELETSDGSDFGTLEVSWGNSVASGNSVAGTVAAPTTIHGLPSCTDTVLEHSATRSERIPLLRLDLTGIAGGSYERDNLLRDTDYLYLEACRGAATTVDYDFQSVQRGQVVRVPCGASDPVSSDTPCRVRINNIDSQVATDRVLARMRSVYANAVVEMSGTNASGVPIQFEGTQIGVDVTARANDVVRRLRVSVPFDRDVIVPEAALHVFDGICKRLDVRNETAGSVDIEDFCDYGFSGPTVDACDLILNTYISGIAESTFLNPTPPGRYGPANVPCPGSTVDACDLILNTYVTGIAETDYLNPSPPGRYGPIGSPCPSSTVEACDLILNTYVTGIPLSDYLNPTPPGRYGPQNVACGAPNPCGDSLNFNIASYANTQAFPYPFSLTVLDVVYNYQTDPVTGVRDTGPNHRPVSNPHIPLDSFNLVLDPACTYEIDYTAFCKFWDPAEPVREPDACGSWDGPGEAAQIQFYESYTAPSGALSVQCGGALRASINTNDLSDINNDNITDNRSWTESGIPLNINSFGDVNCMRFVHMCEIDVTSSWYCSAPDLTNSIHIEEIDWNVL